MLAHIHPARRTARPGPTTGGGTNSRTATSRGRPGPSGQPACPVCHHLVSASHRHILDTEQCAVLCACPACVPQQALAPVRQDQAPASAATRTPPGAGTCR